jgi:RNA polymerase sigma factor (sigma-70 family)
MTAENSALSLNHAFWENAFVKTFNELCSRASRKLTHGDVAAAEDLVSQTFTKMMSSEVKTEDIKHPVRYLWIAVKYAWFNQQKKLDVRNTVLLEDLDVKELSQPAFKLEPRIQQELERQELRERLMFQLGPITLDEKEAVGLKLDDCSDAEIARELGETVEKTRLRWHRMRARQKYRMGASRKR